MKFLIWLGCSVLYSFFIVWCGSAGVSLGGIPTLILSAIFLFVLPKIFFKKYDAYQEAKELQKALARQNEELNTISASTSTTPHSETTDIQELLPKKNRETTVNPVANANNQKAPKKVRVHIKKDENVAPDKTFQRLPRKRRAVIIILSCIIALLVAICAYLGYCAYTYNSLLQEFSQTTDDLITYIEDLEETNSILESEIQEIEKAAATESTVDPKYAHKEGFVFGYKKGYIEAYSAAARDFGAIYNIDYMGYKEFLKWTEVVDRVEANAEHYAKQRFEDFLNFFQYHGLQ